MICFRWSEESQKVGAGLSRCGALPPAGRTTEANSKEARGTGGHSRPSQSPHGDLLEGRTAKDRRGHLRRLRPLPPEARGHGVGYHFHID